MGEITFLRDKNEEGGRDAPLLYGTVRQSFGYGIEIHPELCEKGT